MSGGKKSVTVGYKYFLGVHMIICHGPVDKITRISVDGRSAWSGDATGGTISINASDLFGGLSREGGVSGSVDILMGESTQPRNTYLQSKIGAAIPAFRGVVSAVLNQVYVGLNPYLKPWAFKTQRIHKTTHGATQWYDSKSQIGIDMNPAHIIRECLTDSVWGLGYGASDIDDASFAAAADQLYVESLGLSLLWDKSMAINEFIQLVLSHIQGSLYISRVTGKFTIKLSRPSYVIDDLLQLDESSVSKIVNFKRASTGDLINSVTVIYWDDASDKENAVTVQDIALIAEQGCVISTTKQYPGFTNSANAIKAASTELQALSSPLASATIYANRKAANLNVGDVFKLSWPRYGITNIVFRVTSIELGTIDNNAVKIEAVEDVFSIASTAYAPPPTTIWQDPISQPSKCLYEFLYDAPYWDIAQILGDTDAQALDATSSYVQAIGVRPTSDALSAQLHSKSTGEYKNVSSLQFCPTAKVVQAVGYTDTTINVSDWIDRDLVPLGSYAIVNNEIIVIDAVSSTFVTVRRGCLDTVPAQHAVNSRIYFADDFAATDEYEYASGDTARIKLLPITGKGTLSINSATELTASLSARQNKPYAPGKFRLNNAAYPATISGYLTVSWTHRDRLLQTVKPIIDTNSGNIGPEPGVTYTLQLYGNGTLRKTLTNLTTTSYTWTTEALDSGGSEVSLLLNFNGANNSTNIIDETGKTVSVFGSAKISTAESRFGGSSLYLNGSDSYLSIPAEAQVVGTVNWTIEAFINPPAVPTGAIDIIYSQHNAAVAHINFEYRTDGFLAVFIGSTSTYMISNTLLPTNQFTHVVLQRRGTVIELYQGGSLVASMSAGSANFQTGTGRIGREGGSNTTLDWLGYIDDFRITLGQARYNGSFTPPDTQLTVTPPVLNSTVRVVLKSVRSGVDSYQSHDVTVSRN